jgi:hypothetical protein
MLLGPKPLARRRRTGDPRGTAARALRGIAFVASDERSERVDALYAAGVVDVVESWPDLEVLLT